MPHRSDFGIIVCTCGFDYFLAKACVASVRHALPDTPITVFLDDDVDASALVKAYNVNLFYRRDVKDPYLREFNTGWGRPKITLFWESPYERFLYLDCDTIMWGDVPSQYLEGDWDMVIDAGDVAARPWVPGVGTDQWVDKEYYNLRKMEACFPGYPWRKYSDWCFCTGAFAARRGIFPLDEYKNVMQVLADTPGLFPPGEMGYLNFMIFRAVEEGRLKVSRQLFQLICDFSNEEQTREAYKIVNGAPAVVPGATKILHFTDPKPLMSSKGFNEPFVHFRKDAARRIWHVPGALASPLLRAEELPWRGRVFYRRRLGGLHRKYVRPLQFWKPSATPANQ